MKKVLLKLAKAVGVAAFWLGIWALASFFVGKEVLLPSPLSAGKALLSLAVTADFWISCAASLLRVCAGLLAGAVLGIATAVLSLCSKTARALLSPALSVIRATPVASFIILAFVWLSRGTIPVFTSSLIVLPVVWSSVTAAAGGIDKKLCEVAEVFRLPTKKRLRYIYIPSILPYFAQGLKTSLGMAWKAGVAAEVLCTPARSIGASLNGAKVYLETPVMFAWTAAVIILSMLLEYALGRLLTKVTEKYSQGTGKSSGKEEAENADSD